MIRTKVKKIPDLPAINAEEQNIKAGALRRLLRANAKKAAANEESAGMAREEKSWNAVFKKYEREYVSKHPDATIKEIQEMIKEDYINKFGKQPEYIPTVMLADVERNELPFIDLIKLVEEKRLNEINAILNSRKLTSEQKIEKVGAIIKMANPDEYYYSLPTFEFGESGNEKAVADIRKALLERYRIYKNLGDLGQAAAMPGDIVSTMRTLVKEGIKALQDPKTFANIDREYRKMKEAYAAYERGEVGAKPDIESLSTITAGMLGVPLFTKIPRLDATTASIKTKGSPPIKLGISEYAPGSTDLVFIDDETLPPYIYDEDEVAFAYGIDPLEDPEDDPFSAEARDVFNDLSNEPYTGSAGYSDTTFDASELEDLGVSLFYGNNYIIAVLNTYDTEGKIGIVVRRNGIKMFGSDGRMTEAAQNFIIEVVEGMSSLPVASIPRFSEVIASEEIEDPDELFAGPALLALDPVEPSPEVPRGPRLAKFVGSVPKPPGLKSALKKSNLEPPKTLDEFIKILNINNLPLSRGLKVVRGDVVSEKYAPYPNIELFNRNIMIMPRTGENPQTFYIVYGTSDVDGNFGKVRLIESPLFGLNGNISVEAYQAIEKMINPPPELPEDVEPEGPPIPEDFFKQVARKSKPLSEFEKAKLDNPITPFGFGYTGASLKDSIVESYKAAYHEKYPTLTDDEISQRIIDDYSRQYGDIDIPLQEFRYGDVEVGRSLSDIIKSTELERLEKIRKLLAKTSVSAEQKITDLMPIISTADYKEYYKLLPKLPDGTMPDKEASTNFRKELNSRIMSVYNNATQVAESAESFAEKVKQIKKIIKLAADNLKENGPLAVLDFEYQKIRRAIDLHKLASVKKSDPEEDTGDLATAQKPSESKQQAEPSGKEPVAPEPVNTEEIKAEMKKLKDDIEASKQEQERLASLLNPPKSAKLAKAEAEKKTNKPKKAASTSSATTEETAEEASALSKIDVANRKKEEILAKEEATIEESKRKLADKMAAARAAKAAKAARSSGSGGNAIGGAIIGGRKMATVSKLGQFVDGIDTTKLAAKPVLMPIQSAEILKPETKKKGRPKSQATILKEAALKKAIYEEAQTRANEKQLTTEGNDKAVQIESSNKAKAKGVPKIVNNELANPVLPQDMPPMTIKGHPIDFMELAGGEFSQSEIETILGQIDPSCDGTTAYLEPYFEDGQLKHFNYSGPRNPICREYMEKNPPIEYINGEYTHSDKIARDHDLRYTLAQKEKDPTKRARMIREADNIYMQEHAQYPNEPGKLGQTGIGAKMLAEKLPFMSSIMGNYYGQA